MLQAAAARKRLATRFRRPRCPIASVASKSATRAGVCATVFPSKRHADKDTARHPGDWKTPMRWVRFVYRGGRLSAPWVAENALAAADHPATVPESPATLGRWLAQREGLGPADGRAWPTAYPSWLTHAGLCPCKCTMRAGRRPRTPTHPRRPPRLKGFVFRSCGWPLASQPRFSAPQGGQGPDAPPIDHAVLFASFVVFGCLCKATPPRTPHRTGLLRSWRRLCAQPRPGQQAIPEAR
jgi:hypothetical protein